MWFTPFAKTASMDFPAPHFPRKGNLRDVRRFDRKAKFNTQFRRCSAECALRRTIQNPLTGSIEQAQAIRRVEGKDRHVNLLHHLAQQGRRFQRPKSLPVQSLAQGVDFPHHFPERVMVCAAARANRKIAFSQRGEHVGKCAQRERHAILSAECESQPRHNDDYGERPRGFRVVISSPQKNQRDCRTDQPGKQGAEKDAAFVSERLHSPYFCNRRYSALRLRPSALLAWLTLPP